MFRRSAYEMTEPTQDITLAQAKSLLIRYGFEMKGYIPQELIDKWIKDYSAKWIRAAIVEALYQGRYKAISVEQILKLWQRRKQITCHFTHEFERLICRNLPYCIDSPINSSGEMSYYPKTSERKIQRKSFNPPLTHEQKTVFESNPHQLNPENPVPQSQKDLNEETQLSLKSENYQPSEHYGKHSSPILRIEQPLTDNTSNELNQLPTPNDEDNLPLNDPKINNTHHLKAHLTNLEELFTQFFTDGDSDQSKQSVSYSHLEEDYQWRETISGRCIDEFTPQLDSSELYSKLKAVMQQESQESSQVR